KHQRSLRRQHASQRLETVLVIWNFADGVDFAESDAALFIHDENGTLADTRNRIAGAEYSIFARDFAMRPEVASQRIAQHADIVLLPRDVAVNRIHVNAQDLGIIAGELV